MSFTKKSGLAGLAFATALSLTASANAALEVGDVNDLKISSDAMNKAQATIIKEVTQILMRQNNRSRPPSVVKPADLIRIMKKDREIASFMESLEERRRQRIRRELKASLNLPAHTINPTASTCSLLRDDPACGPSSVTKPSQTSIKQVVYMHDLFQRKEIRANKNKKPNYLPLLGLLAIGGAAVATALTVALRPKQRKQKTNDLVA